MKKNQTLKTSNGVEVVLFPMEYMNITQGIDEIFSHKGDMALDLAGKDTGIDPIYMPCTMKVVWKDANIGGVLYESTSKVHMADGTEDFIHMLTLHDNKISDLEMNKIFKQGQETGDEGTAGRATGNHVHLVFGLGKYKGGYPMVQNNYGTWVLPKQKDPRKVMFINGTIIKNDKGYEFKTYKEETIKSFLPAKGYLCLGDRGENVGKISSFMYKTFPAYTSKQALGNYYGSNIKKSILEFQKRTGLKQDGCVGPKTLAELIKYGFKY